jgi:hypothetical protein
MLAADLFYIWLYGSTEPYQDDWDIVPAFTGHQPVTLGWLWSQHNEHRLPAPRLLLLGLLSLGNGDFRAGMIVSALSLGALAWAVIHVAGRLRGRSAWTDLCFPVLLLNWGNFENLLWAWQVAFVASMVVAGTLLVLIARGEFPWSPGRAVLAGFCLLLLPLSGGTGLPFVLPLALWATIMGRTLCRAGTTHARRAGVTLVACAVAAAGLTVFYFKGSMATEVRNRDVVVALRTALEFLALSFGLFGTLDVYGPSPWLRSYYWLVLPTAAVMAYALAAWLAVRASRSPEGRLRALGLLFFLVGMAVMVLGIVFRRAEAGHMNGLTPRYATLAAPGMVCAVLIFLLYGGRLATWLQAGVLVLVSLVAWPATVEGWHYGRGLRMKFARFEADVRAGLPPLVLADRYTRFPVAIRPRNREADLAIQMDWLREAGSVVFGAIHPDPVYRTVAATALAREVGPNSFLIKPPRFVYAIRVHYRLSEPADSTLQVEPFDFSWLVVDRQTGRQREQKFQVSVTQDGNDNHVHVWVNERIGALALGPPPDWRNCSVDLLVRPRPTPLPEAPREGRQQAGKR